MQTQPQDETFIALPDTDAFEAFYEANRDALDEIADRQTVFALACNCELMIGGGAAPLFRVGFSDGITT